MDNDDFLLLHILHHAQANRTRRKRFLIKWNCNNFFLESGGAFSSRAKTNIDAYDRYALWVGKWTAGYVVVRECRFEEEGLFDDTASCFGVWGEVPVVDKERSSYEMGG